MDAPNKDMEVQRHADGDDTALSNHERGPIVHGVVKWFSNAKGYGFVCTEHCSGDIFAHFSAISAEGYKTLKKGQQVRFELVTGPKGSFASNIEPIDNNAVTGAAPQAALAGATGRDN